jgi:8-oxo-dGTP pyrophosphatase MutT (NUDIX family)
MGKRRRNRPSGATRPTSYTGTNGATYSAEQVTEMLAAQRRRLTGDDGGTVPVAKVFGPGVPEGIRAAEARAQMTPDSPFSPGTPVGPYDGYSRQPRQFDYQTGRNIAARPRVNERMSFPALIGLIEGYDVAQIAINHRIDSIRSLDWKLVAADGHDGHDVSDAIQAGMAALEKPDRVHYWETWLGMWLWDELAYGCGTLYRLRNRGGECIGLLPVDGTTIAPLIDYWGLPPGALEEESTPAAELPEAFVQFANGLPWTWLTRADLIYEPYRLHNNSPYGRAPIESILLAANTDLRHQIYFLQRFTEGNLPHAFASAPETWTPDQIELFQTYWDTFMYGDQARKHQVRWIPGGSSFAWSDEKDFTDGFSLFLMRKTAAAYHVTPADLGFTESVNRSSGESQADVQHRVGDLPFVRYVSRILTGWLQKDLGLPIKHTFDLGEEQADRRDQAEADKIYVDMGAVGSSEIREMRYGMTDPVPVPRYIFTERAGPIPVASLLAVAGQVDPETGLPVPGSALPRQVFGGAEGVLADPPIKVAPLAEQEFGPAALPAAPPAQPPAAGEPVAKDGEATPGITSDTGIYGVDLIDDEDEPAKAPAPVAKRSLPVSYVTAIEPGEDVRKAQALELAAFRRYVKARRKTGAWKDFEFCSGVTAVAAHRLNDQGRAAVRKAAGDLVAAGLAVLAQDTGRVLMLQRALDPDDPAAGKLEFPGGHIEDGEHPVAAAAREWSEETGCILPFSPEAAAALAFGNGRGWVSADGVYAGFVYPVPSEAAVKVRAAGQVANPDDPDGDQAEAIMWMNPADLPGNPAVRDELQASIGDVLAALGCTGAEPAQGDESTCPCGTPVVFDEINGWQHADGSISHDDGESVSDKMAAAIAKCQFCPACDSDLDSAGNCMDWLERGERARQLLGIDGTPGDAQDVPHQFSAEGRHAACAACWLAEGASVHQAPAGIVKAYPAGQSYASHAFRPTEGWPRVCHYCGVGASDPLHDAYRTVAKAGGAGPKDWPGWKLDLQAAGYWQPHVTAAAQQSLTSAQLDGIAAAYIADHPDQDGKATGKRDRNAAALAWLLARGTSVPMGDVADGITADAALIGGASAQAAVGGRDDADTGDWEPGDPVTARQVVEGLGVTALLALLGAGGSGGDSGGGITGDVADDMEDGYLKVVARVLAGWDPDVATGALTDMLADAVADGAYAEALTVTQITAVAGQAAGEYYLATTKSPLRWVAVIDKRTCPACLANAAADPRRYGEEWPSGHIAPPAHQGGCRCALIPEWVS